jgi:histidinol-phosphate aminotransferase
LESYFHGNQDLERSYFEYIKYDDLNFNNNSYLDRSIQLTKQHKNLIIMRTFSKAYGLAGLRIGYTIADPVITSMINKIRVPFNVNRLAQIAAIAAIQDQDYIKKLIKVNHIERLKLYKAFDQLNINYINSKGNFITIFIKNSDMIYNKLLDHGIIVRPLNSYGLADYLRISIGTPEENDCFITTLASII